MLRYSSFIHHFGHWIVSGAVMKKVFANPVPKRSGWYGANSVYRAHAIDNPFNLCYHWPIKH